MTDVSTVLAMNGQSIELAQQTVLSALLGPVQVTVTQGDVFYTASIATLLEYQGIKIQASPDILLSANLPDGIRGYAYSGTITAINVGGATGDIEITVDQLPAGLTLGDTTTQDGTTYTAPITGTLQ
jgi:hypothetical protein